MGSTTQTLRPSPYLLQVTSQTLYIPVQNYSLHLFHSERIMESCNLTQCLTSMIKKVLNLIVEMNLASSEHSLPHHYQHNIHPKFLAASIALLTLILVAIPVSKHFPWHLSIF